MIDAAIDTAMQHISASDGPDDVDVSAWRQYLITLHDVRHTFLDQMFYVVSYEIKHDGCDLYSCWTTVRWPSDTCPTDVDEILAVTSPRLPTLCLVCVAITCHQVCHRVWTLRTYVT